MSTNKNNDPWCKAERWEMPDLPLGHRVVVSGPPPTSEPGAEELGGWSFDVQVTAQVGIDHDGVRVFVAGGETFAETLIAIEDEEDDEEDDELIIQSLQSVHVNLDGTGFPDETSARAAASEAYKNAVRVHHMLTETIG